MMQYSPATISQATALIREGKLVALPTETVYGLGANALDDKAVAAIFAAKNRPDFNPLISHVQNISQAFEFVKHDVRAEKLAAKFWPGALTFILPRRDDCKLSWLVSAGLNCAAVRAPNHPIAQALLKEAGVPIAAPSANRSGKISPTTAAHVAEELGDKVSMIIDGGACQIGIESTVLDLTSEHARLLRPGSITAEMIEEIIGKLSNHDEKKIIGPGMLESHYAPNATLHLNTTAPEKDEAWLAFGPSPIHSPMQNLSPSGNLEEAAANLFAMLRALDKTGVGKIAAAPIPMEGLGVAINDRLGRAAAKR